MEIEATCRFKPCPQWVAILKRILLAGNTVTGKLRCVWVCWNMVKAVAKIGLRLQIATVRGWVCGGDRTGFDSRVCEQKTRTTVLPNFWLPRKLLGQQGRDHISTHYLPDRNVGKLSRAKRFKSSGLVVCWNMVHHIKDTSDRRVDHRQWIRSHLVGASDR